MQSAKRARRGVSPVFVRNLQRLPRELRDLVFSYATLEFRQTAANRIRTAYRLFRRRVQSTVEFFIYTPSAQSRDLGDLGAPRLVRGFRIDG